MHAQFLLDLQCLSSLFLLDFTLDFFLLNFTLVLFLLCLFGVFLEPDLLRLELLLVLRHFVLNFKVVSFQGFCNSIRQANFAALIDEVKRCQDLLFRIRF